MGSWAEPPGIPHRRGRHCGARAEGHAVLALCALCLVLLPGAQAAPGGITFLEEPCPDEFSLQGTARGLTGSRSARVVLNYAGARRFLALELSARQLTLRKVHGGATTLLATAALPQATDGTLRFAVKRRAWRLTLIANGRVVARAYDRELHGGRTGWQASPGVTVALRQQATEPVAFADDFTRGAGEAGPWEALAGRCRVSEVAVGNHEGTPGRYSSNAFSWEVQARPQALCTTGYWFWDHYAVEASVKPETRGAVGIAAYVQDPANLLLFRWTAAAPGRPGSGACQIARVREGKMAVLASRPGGYEPGQWYRLRLELFDGELVAFIDGRPVCRARDDTFGQGKAGLYARNCGRVLFDDVSISAVDGLRDALATDAPGQWEDAAGAWRTDLQSRSRSTLRAGEAMTVTGRPDWHEGVVAAQVTPGKAREVGLLFAYRRPTDTLLFRVPATTPGKAALVAVRGGKRTLLAESAARVAVGKGARLRVETTGGRIRASVGGRQVLAAVLPECPPGRVGLYANGPAGARFRDLAVSFPPAPPPAPRVEAQFAQEESMAGWASPLGSWRPDPAGFFWHTGTFYGNTRARLALPPGASHSTLVLHAQGTEPDTGYRLEAHLAAGGPSRLELYRQGRLMKRTEGAWPADQARQLRLWREEDLIVGTLDGQAAVWFRDPQPLPGTRVGIRSGHGEAGVAALEATGSNLLDCTFAGPPTEWWAARGVWDVAQRWPCDDRWSFFGGLRSESPMLWTKHAYAGNLTVEAWVALYMDAPDDAQVGYTHPSDLNLSICANGKDVSSGYTFQFAACNNTVTRILRREQVVAENRSLLMQNPTRVNLAFQRHWFHLRAEKEGRRVRFFVDGRLAGEYTDPEPLPGGQVALWTWRNGLMVARARVWYEKDAGYVPFPVPAAAPAPTRTGGWRLLGSSPVILGCDFEGGTGGWRAITDGDGPILALGNGAPGGGRHSLRVVNRVSGGDLGVTPGLPPFDAARFPVLQFAYRLPKGVQINLYLRLRRQPLFFGLTAPEVIERGHASLGPVPDLVADGQWHTARVDLRGAIRRLYPALAQLPVAELCFRAPNVEYLRSGFGGNRWGTEYGLDSIRLIGTSQTTPAEAEALLSPK
ncbi:MAG: hypothetical protein GX774_16020 [Armatimonadetes bacterium]|nr:hypothetical protein [Armatimonadota bacterium]